MSNQSPCLNLSASQLTGSYKLLQFGEIYLTVCLIPVALVAINIECQGGKELSIKRIPAFLKFRRISISLNFG